MAGSRVLGLVGCAAGGVESLRTELIVPLLDDGWQVAVTLTPTAWTWLSHAGEVALIERATGFPVRHQPRLPHQTSGHPRLDVCAMVPATASSIAKLALGIGDNQALTQVCELVGSGVPVVVFPRVNAAHARHPRWESHLQALRGAGVRLVYGDDVWPLYEPRTQPSRPIPWHAIRVAIEESKA